jgi:hypothetical protein
MRGFLFGRASPVYHEEELTFAVSLDELAQTLAADGEL